MIKKKSNIYLSTHFLYLPNFLKRKCGPYNIASTSLLFSLDSPDKIPFHSFFFSSFLTIFLKMLAASVVGWW